MTKAEKSIQFLDLMRHHLKTRWGSCQWKTWSSYDHTECISLSHPSGITSIKFFKFNSLKRVVYQSIGKHFSRRRWISIDPDFIDEFDRVIAAFLKDPHFLEKADAQ